MMKTVGKITEERPIFGCEFCDKKSSIEREMLRHEKEHRQDTCLHEKESWTISVDDTKTPMSLSGVNVRCIECDKWLKGADVFAIRGHVDEMDFIKEFYALLEKYKDLSNRTA